MTNCLEVSAYLPLTLYTVTNFTHPSSSFCEKVRWACVPEGLFPLVCSTLSVTDSRRLLRTLRKKCILFFLLRSVGIFLLFQHMKQDDPNEANLISKPQICWDNSRRVLSPLWVGWPLALMGVKETLLSCAMAVAGQMEGVYLPGALSTHSCWHRCFTYMMPLPPGPAPSCMVNEGPVAGFCHPEP